MEKTNSPYENVTGIIIMFVFASLILFVMLAQSHASAEMQTAMTDLFSHH